MREPKVEYRENIVEREQIDDLYTQKRIFEQLVEQTLSLIHI